MNLGKMRDAMWADVSSAKHETAFAAAKARESVLARYSSLEEVISFLHERAAEDEVWAERDLVLRAMVREYQRARSRFWLSVLFVAFTPMLMRLRGRLVGETLTKADLDHLVVEEFFETVARFPLELRPSRTAMFLRQDTQRAVFRRLLAEQRTVEQQRVLAELVQDEEDLLLLTDTPTPEPEAGDSDDEKDEMAERLRELAGNTVPRPRLQLVIDTYVRGEPLQAFVNRRYPELSGTAKGQVYQRLKRERLRTVARLRPVLMPNAPRPELRLIGAA